VNAKPGSVAAIGLFALKFLCIVAVLLMAWWSIQPAYITVIGQVAGLGLRLGGLSLEAMRVEVDASSVLNTETTLVYVSEGVDKRLAVAYLVANIPPFIALVLASPGLGWKRRGRAIAAGVAILAASHIAYLVLAFGFARQIQQAPELPTAFGFFILTMPFILWIALVYRDRIVDLFEENDPQDPAV